MKTNGPNGLCKSASLCVELTVFSSTSQNLLLILSSNKKGGGGGRSVLIAVIHTSVKISACKLYYSFCGDQVARSIFLSFPLSPPPLVKAWMIILMVSMIIIVAGVCNSYWHHLNKLILLGTRDAPNLESWLAVLMCSHKASQSSGVAYPWVSKC